MTIEFDNVQQVHTSCTFKSKRVRDTYLLAFTKCPVSHSGRRVITHFSFVLRRCGEFLRGILSYFFFYFVEPGPIDPPILRDVKSRMMLVTWQHPLKRNGIITHYNIHQHGRLCLKTSGNVTNGTVVHLRPYTAYTFQVEACTSKGCSLSPESQTVWTLPDAPEGIPRPELFSDTPTSVIISWQPPTHPNGLVENFTIERRVEGKEEATTLVTFPRGHPMRFIDKTSALSPWTKYEYRVLMSTLGGGTNSSAWAEVTTRPSRPAGVQPPVVDVLGPDAAKVRYGVSVSTADIGIYPGLTLC